MPTPTYTALANITLGSSASSVTFSSIPATYRDLVLVAWAKRTSGGYGDMKLELNGSTSDMSRVYVYNTSSGSGTGNDLGFTGTDGILNIVNFMDYSATDKHKTMLVRWNLPTDFVSMTANRWAQTAAITSIKFTDPASTFTAGTTFALYGIAS
jgi:hypothetical protein